MKNKDIHSHNTRSNNLLRIHRGTVTFTNLSVRVSNVITRTINVYVIYSGHIISYSIVYPYICVSVCPCIRVYSCIMVSRYQYVSVLVCSCINISVYQCVRVSVYQSVRVSVH